MTLPVEMCSLANVSISCTQLHRITNVKLYKAINLSCFESVSTPAYTRRVCLLARTLLLRPDLARKVHDLSITIVEGYSLEVKHESWDAALVQAEAVLATIPGIKLEECRNNRTQQFVWANILLCITTNLRYLRLDIRSTQDGEERKTLYDDDRYNNSVFWKPPRILSFIENGDFSVIPGLHNLQHLRIWTQFVPLDIGALPNLCSLQIGLGSDIKEAYERIEFQELILDCDPRDFSYGLIARGFEYFESLQKIEALKLRIRNGYEYENDQWGVVQPVLSARSVKLTLDLLRTETLKHLCTNMAHLEIQIMDNGECLGHVVPFTTLSEFVSLKSLSVPQGALPLCCDQRKGDCKILNEPLLPASLEDLSLTYATARCLHWLRIQLPYTSLEALRLYSNDAHLKEFVECAPSWLPRLVTVNPFQVSTIEQW